MSIKVSQEVTSRLDEVRKGLNAESNAVVLRLSLIIGLKEKLFDIVGALVRVPWLLLPDKS